jgi:Mg-chelatase subunit ChlD
MRPGIDLICVIDVSYSMNGKKLALVKETLLYLLELLNESDRLSLVSFSD